MRLAESDKRLYQPQRLGPYFDGRIVKRKYAFIKAQDPPAFSWRLAEYRKIKSGGQLSANEVLQNANRFLPGKIGFQDSLLINKLAVDLAYTHIDRRGYKHQFFAWGDIPEINRRVTIYKSNHGLTPSEAEYLEEIKSDASPLVDEQDI